MRHILNMKMLLIITFSSIAFNCFSQIPTRGLIGNWTFSGNPNDLSGNNLHGSVNGAILTTDRFGNQQKAYSFNGTNSSIDIPLSSLYNFSTTDSFTISLWVKTGSLTTCQSLVVKGGTNNVWDFGLYITGSSCPAPQQPFYTRVMFGKEASPLIYSSTAIDTNWHHVAGVYKNFNWTLYLDTVLQGIYNNIPILTNTNQISFGKKGMANNDYFTGSLDDIRIYNSALSSNELKGLYSESNPNKQAQLYINGAIYLQSNAILYADDTISLGSNAVVTNNGIIQSTKKINTNGYPIFTLNNGYIQTPIQSGLLSVFDIGTNSNNKIQILHNTGSNVVFKLGVNDNVYVNPQTKTTSITANAVNKTWQVQPLTNANNVTASLFWNVADEQSGFNRSFCAVSRWQDLVSTNWTYLSAPTTATNTGANPSYSQSLNLGNLSNSIHFLGIGGIGSTLPITLLSFNVIKVNNDAFVEWETANELNNSYFEVLYSIDKTNWNIAGKVNGMGNSNTNIKYNYLDKKPFEKYNSSVIYYQLRQVDFNGNSTVSKVKSIKNNENESVQINVFPNPFTSEININSLQTIDIRIIDELGKIIYNQNQLPFNVNLSINLSHLSNGIYFLRSKDSDGNISNFKLIKQ